MKHISTPISIWITIMFSSSDYSPSCLTSGGLVIHFGDPEYITAGILALLYVETFVFEELAYQIYESVTEVL